MKLYSGDALPACLSRATAYTALAADGHIKPAVMSFSIPVVMNAL
jgi:hypothetical protein